MRSPTFIPQSPSRRDQYIAQLAQSQRSLRPSESAGVRTSHTTLGVMQEVIQADDGGGGSSSETEQLLVSDVYGDYLGCRRITVDASNNITIDSTELLVAKPNELRLGVWSQATLRGVVYTNTGGTAAQTRMADNIAESLTPSYVGKYSFDQSNTDDPAPSTTIGFATIRGMIITAANVGKTLLVVSHRTGNQAITWIDVNCAGRQFLSSASSLGQAFYLDTIADNYVGGFPYDAVTGAYGSRVNIAKAEHLRGPNRRTTGGSNGNSWSEYMIPPYENGGIVYALYVPDRIEIGTGLYTNWIDVNASGRRYDLPKRAMAVCEDGVSKYVVLRASTEQFTTPPLQPVGSPT
jgi:hypothetical protein